MDKEKVIKKIKQGAPATSAIVVAACIGMSLSGYQAPVYEAQAQTKETKTTDAEVAKKTESKAKGSFDLADGIYKGTGTGYAGEVTVAVTIKDKQITAIDILSSSDDVAFFNRAKAVIDRIIAGQTLDVDVVSGATFSSNGIISAVKNALTGEKTVERRENPSPEMQRYREVHCHWLTCRMRQRIKMEPIMEQEPDSGEL